MTEAYRRIRNTCRYLLGNLNDFDPETDKVAYSEMQELDLWALNSLQQLSKRVQHAYNGFEFHLVYHDLHNFCVLDLSSFYLDIIKDRLYTSPPESVARRSAQTAMNEILEVLVRLMAPVLSFTADEIWQYMKGKRPLSVHADTFLPSNEDCKDPALMERWAKIIAVRKEVTKALEIARKEKIIGHPLDALVILGVSGPLMEALSPYSDQLRSIFIVSDVILTTPEQVKNGFESEEIAGMVIGVSPSKDPKCERCWIREPSVGQNDEHPTICKRCLNVLDEITGG